MASLVTVITLVLTGQPLTPVNVFMLLSFINLLRMSVSMGLSYFCLLSYDAYVSLGRIQDFLHLNNLSPVNAIANQREGTEKVIFPSIVAELTEPTILRVRNLTLRRQLDQKDESVLQGISFVARKGSLIAITGPVGSGKSTLLSAVAGEIPDESGAITFKGTVVYVPQIAWIFSGTIRENILFGEQYEKSKYDRVIEACALTQDIQGFPDFDQTIVGEHGAVLSGGQRARVNLARAVYAEADLYLLDDPLTAVDFKVGHHIFRECIKGLLGEKTRLITSHQERIMREADDVIVLSKGRMLGKGSFTELKENGILNTTVDSLYEQVKESDDGIGKEFESEQENQIADLKGTPAPHNVEGLQLSEEDRAIGVVSPKLYWNYFRSGVPLLVIIAGICLCFITQGNVQIVGLKLIDTLSPTRLVRI